MSKGISAFLAGCVLLAAGSVHAATFNFRTLIDTSSGSITGTLGDGGSFSGNPGELAFQTFDWTDGGITLTASATYVTGSGTVAAYAYLDKGGAGLGVCRVITSSGNQCTPSSDDNVTVGERLHYGFDQAVAIDLVNIELRDADHIPYASIPDPVQVSINGGSFVQLNSLSVLSGSQFVFRTTSDSGQFYISTLNVTAVPEPSTWLMMGLGVVGLMVLRRRA